MTIKFGSAIFKPKYAPAVEKAGFDSIWVPDHFAPFSHEAGLRDSANAGGWMSLPSLPMILSNDKMRSWHKRVVPYLQISSSSNSTITRTTGLPISR